MAETEAACVDAMRDGKAQLVIMTRRPRAMVIDVLRVEDGKVLTAYGRKTLDEAMRQHPGAEVMPIEAAHEACCDQYRTDPAQCGAERFLEMLEVLPPLRWQRRGASESFMVGEMIYGDIAAIFVRLGREDGEPTYWSFNDRVTLGHDEIVARATAAAAALAANAPNAAHGDRTQRGT